MSERDSGDPRVLLRPSEVASLVRFGSICVEAGLGDQIGFADSDYIAAGAQVVTAAEAWQARLVVKFKSPTLESLRRLGPNSTIAAMMHAEGNRALVDGLLECGARAIAFEYLTVDGTSYPCMQATGAISGYQAITLAAYYLQRPFAGVGRLFASVAALPGAQVLIIGLGTVGKAAASAALALGAQVRVVHSASRRDCLCGYECVGPGDVRLASHVARSDVIVGALRISTFDTPAMVTDEMVRQMRPGSVIIDVTAGYGGGYLETSTELTTLEQPVRVVHGISHVKIRNLPRAVPEQSVALVSQVFAPTVGELMSLPEPPWTRSGLVTENGRVTHDEVRRHFPDLPA